VDVDNGFMDSPYFAVFSAIGSFFVGLVGALMAWRRGSHDKEAQFREDILKANTELRAEVEKLKVRVDTLERDLHEAMKVSRGWELKFARARLLLMEKHSIDLDDLLAEDDEVNGSPV
jgi:hypothetical protein